MIPQHYPIEPGTLFGGEYPGDRKPEVPQTPEQKNYMRRWKTVR